MATAMRKQNRARKIQNAVRSIVEHLEARQLLAAGQLDPTWGFGATPSTSGYLVQSELAAEYGPMSLYDTTNKHYYDWSNPASADSGYISNQDVFVDAGGKIVTVGSTLGRHLANTTAKYVIPDPNSTGTLSVNVAEFFDSDLSLTRYTYDGTRDYYMTVGSPLPAPSDRDFYSVNGPYPAPGWGSLYDNARAGAVDKDGSIVMVGTSGYSFSMNGSMVLARYNPSSNVLPQTLGIIAGPKVPWSINDMVIQPDGKILVAGSYGTGLTGRDFTIWRFNANFTLDGTFGAGGVVTQNFNSYSNDEAMAIALEPATITDSLGTTIANPDAGKIVAIGYTDNSTWLANGTSNMVIARFNTDGSFDKTWGINGIYEVDDLGGQDAIGLDVKIQPDGKILALGGYDANLGLNINPALTRGARDAYARDYALDSTILVRISPDGTLDQNFGARGRVQVSGANAWLGESLALESTGKIVIGGVTTDATGTYASAVRITTDGRVDDSPIDGYGTGGFETLTSLGSTVMPDLFYKVHLAMQPDDKAILTANREFSVTYTGGGADGLTDSSADFAAEGVIARLQADNKAPTAQLLSKDITVKDASVATVDFLVNYSDDGYVDVNTINNNTNSILVTGPGGYLQYAVRVGAAVGAGPTDAAGNYSHFTVTYRVTRPALPAGWTNGAYTIQLQDDPANLAGIADTMGLYSPPRTLGQFAVQAIPIDTAAPVTTLARLPGGNVLDPGNFGLTVGGATSLDFILKYDDALNQVNFARLGNGNILVTGPSGYSQLAVFIGATDINGNAIKGNANPVYARYRIPAPHGIWGTADNGAYSIKMQPNQVCDTFTTPNFVPAGEITKFNVAVVPGTDVRPTAYVSDVNGVQLVTIPPYTEVAASQLLYVHYKPSVYSTSGKINLATITNNNAVIEVVSVAPAYDVFASYVSATSDGNGGYVVAYSMTQPGNAPWTNANNGTYSVRVAPNQIDDMDVPPNYVPGGEIAQFNVIIPIDAMRPTATLTPIGNISSVTGPFNFIVTFAPSTLAPGSVINPAGIPTGIKVIGPVGVTLNYTYVSKVAVAGGGYAATYTVAPSDNSFDSADNGTYTVSVNLNTVYDTQAPAVSVKAGSIGSFTVNIVRPTATLLPVTVTTPTTGLDFSVAYYSSDGISLASLVGNNNVITVVGPNGYSAAARYVSNTVAADGTITVVYHINAPINSPGASAVWSAIANGTYIVSVAPGNGVVSIKGDTLAPGGVGTFLVNVSSGLFVGQLDLTYNQTGYLGTQGSTAPVMGPIPFIPGVTQEPGGKLIYSGTTVGAEIVADPHDVTNFYYARYTQDGTFDTSLSWGTVHIVPSPTRYSPADDESIAVLMQSTGKFVLIGRTTLRSSGGSHPTIASNVLSMSRVFPTGGLDGSFDDADPNHNVPEWTGGTTAYEANGLLTGLTVHDAYVQSDDKIVVVASKFFADTGYDWIVARINADGTIDNTFGNGGAVRITSALGAPANSAFSSYAMDEPLAVAVQSDNKVVIGGYSDTRTFDQYNGYRKFVVVRLNADGTRDNTFDGDGIAEDGDFGKQDAAIEAIAIQKDGKILAVGYAGSYGVMVRFNANGSIDGTFGNRGLVQIDGTFVPVMSPIPTASYGARWGYDVSVTGSGEIIVTSRDATQTKVYTNRYFANGTPDTSYGINGRGSTSPTDLGGFNIQAFRSLIQSDGKLVVAGTNTGTSTTGSVYELATARFLGDNGAPQGVLQASNIERVPTVPYTFTVTYTDDFLIDASTLDVNDVYVILPDGTTKANVSKAVASTLVNSKTIVVTYTFDAPGGTWDASLNGNYQVWQNASQVYDIDGKLALAAPARNLGAFVVRINPPGVVAPTAELQPNPGQVAYGSTFLDLVVTYTDDQSVNFSTISADNLRVIGPNFYLADNAVTAGSVVLVSVTKQDGTPAVASERVLIATYRITALGGSWQFLQNGTYTVFLKPDQVSDADPVPNFVPGSLTQSLGDVQVSVFVDQVPPTAAINLPNTIIAGATNYLFTVTYTDNGAVLLSSLDDNDIRVSGPNGYDARAKFISATPSMDNGTIVGTYQIIPPGGTWDISDAGNYQFFLNSGQVSDTAAVPNYAAGGQLGSLTVASLVDTVPPAATLTPLGPITSTRPSISAVITFTDNAAVNVLSIDVSNIIIKRISDGTQYSPTSVSVDLSTSGTPRTATYVFDGPSGSWAFANNGDYQIIMKAGSVDDTAGNPIAGSVLGNVVVNVPQDLASPTVAMVTAPNVTQLGGTYYDFTVKFSDDVAVRFSSLGNTNFVVDTPLNGITLAATLMSTTLSTDGTPITATYRITPPGGVWNATQAGTYNIRLIANQVFDTSNKPVAAGVVGSFIFVNDAPTAELPAAVVPPLPGTAIVTVTVLYRDDYAIDATTIGVDDITVYRSSDMLQLTPVGAPTVNVPGNGTPRTVTYTFAAPGGSWNYLDNGDYTVAMMPNSVKDIGGKAVAGGSLGTFTFTDLAPVVTAVVTPIVAATPNPMTVTFTLTDDQGIDVTTLKASNFAVFRKYSNPPMQLAQVPGSFVVAVNGASATVTLQFLPPGGYWDWTDNGFYTPVMASGAKDLGGQPAQTGDLTPYNLNVPVDLVAPAAALTFASTITSEGVQSYAFQVTYTDNVAVVESTIDSFDVVVIAPNGDRYDASLVANSVTPTTDAASITAVYHFDHVFTVSDNGQWQVQLKSSAISDVSGNFASNGPIGDFKVQVPDTVAPVVSLNGPLTPPVQSTPTVPSVDYRVTVIYTDAGGIDVTTISNSNVRVYRPGQPDLTALGTPLVDTTSAPKNTQVKVTYTFTAPGGTWDFPDDGTYQVWMVGGQVRDLAGNVVVGSELGTFKTNFVNQPPVVTAVVTPPVLGPADLVVTLTLTDDVAVNMGLINKNTITVCRTAGGSSLTLEVDGNPVIANATNGSPRTAVFSFKAPGGFWQYLDNGTYQVQLADNAVSDTSGAYTPGGPISTFQVAFPVDLTPPTATLTIAPAVTSTNVVRYAFQVTFADNVAVDYTTIGTSAGPDVKVVGTIVCSDGSTKQITYDALLVQNSITPATTYAASLTVYYYIDIPGGFQFADNGVYSVQMQPNTVSDVSGNFVNAGPIGEFKVAVPDTVAPIVCLDGPLASPVQSTPLVPSVDYRVTVIYKDDGGIDLTTISNTNIRVYRPGSLDLVALGTPLVDTTSAPKNTQVRVTYTFAAPGGTWDFSDQGTYQVWMVGGQVRDLAGNLVVGGQLGTFTTDFVNQPPVVTAVVTPPVLGPADLVVTLTLTDDVAVNMGLINKNTITVCRTAGASTLTLEIDGNPVIANATNGSPRTVVFSFKAPGGYWESKDNGTYQVILADNAVSDTSGAYTPGGPISTFQVAFEVDLTPPTAAVTIAPALTAQNATTYAFQVTFADNVAVDYTTIGTSSGPDIKVVGSILQPDGTTKHVYYDAKLVANSITPVNTYAASITAYYSITSNSGFATADNGTYTIEMQPNTVKDVSCNFVNPGSIGAFQVRVPDSGAPTVSLDQSIVAPVQGATTYKVVVTYTDDGGVDLTTIKNGNIQILRAGSPSLLASGTPSIQPKDALNTSVEVTYTFTAPGGTWNYLDAGTYQVSLAGNQVSDVFGNLAPGQVLGSFTYVDKAPVASLAAPYAMPTLGAGNITLTIRYEDEGAINPATFAATNIVVTRTSGGSSYTLVSAGAPTFMQPTGSPNKYKVTYSFLAPDFSAPNFQGPNGYWSSLANGTYTIKLLSNQVADVGGAQALGTDVGTFKVAFTVDTTPPKATLVPAATTVPSIATPVQTYDIVVEYNDNVGMNLQTLDSGDIAVRCLNTASPYYAKGNFYPTFVSAATPNTLPNGLPDRRTVRAVYRLQLSGPIDATANGTWQVKANANQVGDVSGNFIPNGTKIGTFAVNCAVPSVVATLGSVSPAQPGAAYVQVVVNYNSAYPINIQSLISSSNGTDNILKAIRPDGSYAKVQLLMPALQNRLAETLTYRVYARNGSFTGSDNGSYILKINAGNGVTNSVGGTLKATNLGTFNVNVPGSLASGTVTSADVLSLNKMNDLLK